VLRNLPKSSIYVIEGARKHQPRADLKKAMGCHSASGWLGG
jgi:hypothetical protein